ncbi:hypothetical protein BY996DRAFT_4604682 [Phakopsora pachyrhizi]|uniref:Transcription elongation factor Eaf N-terminal domain-containing protein n=1 Tax=Phakopsora pachyrhizi TaxID=170000 RepID=A0AAV0AEI8_PHAPC|nr:hypothetical protein BY996DRAFT_4604682 [Phakopsora pachyrhizi]CAH7666508.1 hypothetical protein PPACK8108_LOCUS862 [Phakopsora pachyrhizi]CAH7684020.1 hypothetical protein PPACK8108_LOCUS17930 [Phakopsora pachyrhizi]
MSTATAPLPSGPLRFAPSNSASSKPHTFSLRYPASHPSDLSTVGASLTSAASGDVSLRMNPSPSMGEPRGRRWAGREVRPGADVECAIVWDVNQHCWILHRLDNVVQLAPDDPEPLPKKTASGNHIPTRTVPLALPKPALPAPPPPVVSLQANKTDLTSKRAHPDSQLKNSHSNSLLARSQSNPTLNGNQTQNRPYQAHLDHKLSATQVSLTHAARSNTSSSASSDTQATNKKPDQSNFNLALPSKKSTNTNINHNHPAKNYSLSSTSSPGEQGPIRVVQADEVEEFDFVDSPPDPEPTPTSNTALVGPSPATAASPTPASVSTSASNRQTNHQRGTTSEMTTSPGGRPTLSRSSSVIEHNGMNSGSPLGRPNGNHGLALPSRPSANRPSAPSPAYPYSALSRQGNISTQPSAPSPLQSVACSSESSPNATQTAATPQIVSVSPPSASATTVESAHGQVSSSRSNGLHHSVLQNGRPGGGSPAPAWQYNQHYQQQPRNGSPHGINGARSPAPANPHMGLVKTNSTSSVPQRAYQRSDSGSSVRESDTDSEEEEEEDDDGDDDEEMSGEEVQFEQVLPLQPALVVEPPKGSEEDAEAEEDDEDEDEEFELQNFATELEASMLIGDYCGSGAAGGGYGDGTGQMAPLLNNQEAAPVTGTKPKNSKKSAANNKSTGVGKSGAKLRGKGKALKG